MNHQLFDSEDTLCQRISGFHRYVLTEPIHLSYVSQDLCRMLDMTADSLSCRTADLYAPLVHPADRHRYDLFLADLRRNAGTYTCRYRLIRPDGTVISVHDRAVSTCREDGTWTADSVVTDITQILEENNQFHFLSSTIPCGFLRYTCEKQPRITYISDTMIQMLRIPLQQAGEADYLDLCRNNLFFLIPMTERRRFSKYLRHVYASGGPIAGEMSVQRWDGTKAYLFGWVTKCVNDRGEEEFQSVCMDITDRYRQRTAAETRRYIRALTDVYEKIFAFDLAAGTVKCLACQEDSTFNRLENISMEMEDATERWIAALVVPEDRDQVRRFFLDFRQKRLPNTESKPPQIVYRARSACGETFRYLGLFIEQDETTSLYCCRRVHEEDGESLRTENHRLKEDLKDLVSQFTDGIAAFAVTADGLVTPLYTSENVCEFFGYTKEEWLPLMERATPLENFVAYSEASYDDFLRLLQTGEAEFTYFDYKTETERRIKAVCSQRRADRTGSRYVMLYNMEDTKTALQRHLPENRTVFIRTFGYFDVFIGDKPIAFRNKKSKELFALLVDRRGGYITSEEAISFLWEEEAANSVTLARYRKVALRLKNTLEEYGISRIMESVDGKRRIVCQQVQCDLYDYLSGNAAYAHLFRGSYLTNYSWGETTLGELLGKGTDLP